MTTTTALLDMRNHPTKGRTVRAFDRGRGHRFQPPKDVLSKVPPLYATDGSGLDAKTFHVHYFCGGFDWYVAELDQETGEAFGLVKGLETEWGYFNLYDLATTYVPVRFGSGDTRPFNLPIERDKWWAPILSGDLK